MWPAGGPRSHSATPTCTAPVHTPCASSPSPTRGRRTRSAPKGRLHRQIIRFALHWTSTLERNTFPLFEQVCHQFFRWAKAKDPSFDPSDQSRTYSIFLWDTNINRARVTTCYSAQPSRHGWCGTCYNGELEPGEEG